VWGRDSSNFVVFKQLVVPNTCSGRYQVSNLRAIGLHNHANNIDDIFDINKNDSIVGSMFMVPHRVQSFIVELIPFHLFETPDNSQFAGIKFNVYQDISEEATKKKV
jgi:hypothetical protein